MGFLQKRKKDRKKVIEITQEYSDDKPLCLAFVDCKKSFASVEQEIRIYHKTPLKFLCKRYNSDQII